MTRSGGREAAVDRMCGAGRIRGVVRQQVRDEARYVFRRAVATQRNSLGKGLVAAREHLFGQLECHSSSDGTWTAGIDTHLASPLFERGGFGLADYGGVWRVVGAGAPAPPQAPGRPH